nr:MAG TPA: hypothetical protein [Caudoviricetes sp.]
MSGKLKTQTIMIVLCQGSNPKAPFFPPSLSDDKAVARRGNED